MKVLKILGLLIVAGILIFAAMLIFKIAPHVEPLSPLSPAPVITNFDECAAAGNPVMESYPRRCVAGNVMFVENIFEPGPPPDIGTDFYANGCAVAGCSRQLCVSAEEAASIMTTCEYRAEYACYREASCEPQADGKCGWTETPQLQRCLANPEVEMELQVQ